LLVELDVNPVKAVRLMGEDLVLYQGLGGTAACESPGSE